MPYILNDFHLFENSPKAKYFVKNFYTDKRYSDENWSDSESDIDKVDQFSEYEICSQKIPIDGNMYVDLTIGKCLERTPHHLFLTKFNIKYIEYDQFSLFNQFLTYYGLHNQYFMNFIVNLVSYSILDTSNINSYLPNVFIIETDPESAFHFREVLIFFFMYFTKTYLFDINENNCESMFFLKHKKVAMTYCDLRSQTKKKAIFTFLKSFLKSNFTQTKLFIFVDKISPDKRSVSFQNFLSLKQRYGNKIQIIKFFEKYYVHPIPSPDDFWKTTKPDLNTISHLKHQLFSYIVSNCFYMFRYLSKHSTISHNLTNESKNNTLGIWNLTSINEVPKNWFFRTPFFVPIPTLEFFCDYRVYKIYTKKEICAKQTEQTPVDRFYNSDIFDRNVFPIINQFL